MAQLEEFITMHSPKGVLSLYTAQNRKEFKSLWLCTSQEFMAMHDSKWEKSSWLCMTPNKGKGFKEPTKVEIKGARDSVKVRWSQDLKGKWSRDQITKKKKSRDCIKVAQSRD